MHKFLFIAHMSTKVSCVTLS